MSDTRRSIASIVLGERVRADLGDLDGLAASIESLGVLQPVVILEDGQLVAGARRLEAMRRLGWTEAPVVIAANLTEAVAIAKAQRDENTCRKDFTPSEGLKLGALVEGLERGEAAQRKGGRPKKTGVKVPPVSKHERLSETKAARAAGMGRTTYRRAKYVAEAAANGDPAVAAVARAAMAAMDRTGKVDTAYRKVIAAERAAADRSALLDALPADRPVSLLHCSCTELAERLPPASVDAIVTDPPYGAKHLGVYDELAACAATVLRPGGMTLVMTGELHLPEVMRRLAGRLEYWWTFAYLTPGDATRVHARSLRSQWKPVLAYRQPGGDRPPFAASDLIASPAKDNGSHPLGWSQSLAGTRQLVELAAPHGQLVCDPFMGAGSTALACIAAGRRFVGCDIDAALVAQVDEVVAP